MGFLGIGAMEAMVIIVIALIIFGPGRLPTMMGEAGKAIRDFRRATQDLTGDFRESYDEVRETVEDLQKDMRNTARDLENETQSIARSFNDTVNDAADINKPAAKKRAAPRPAQKLDQMLDDGDDLLAIPDETATETAAPASSAKRPAKPAPAASEDLLADDDLLAGDDLLAAGSDEEDLLSMNGASTSSTADKKSDNGAA